MFAKSHLAALTVIAALGCAAAVHAAPVAAASSDPAAMSVPVLVADLNLADRDGAKTALQRIRTAATAICGEAPDARLLERASLHRACIKSSTDRAVASLDSPIVTALNGGQSTAMMVANGR
ncbi:MAG: UrcA family protein [Caulobacteraceae bacterium]